MCKQERTRKRRRCPQFAATTDLEVQPPTLALHLVSFLVAPDARESEVVVGASCRAPRERSPHSATESIHPLHAKGGRCMRVAASRCGIQVMYFWLRSPADLDILPDLPTPDNRDFCTSPRHRAALPSWWPSGSTLAIGREPMRRAFGLAPNDPTQPVPLRRCATVAS